MNRIALTLGALFIFGLGTALGLSLPATAQGSKDGFRPEQAREIERIVREYLVKNPEVLVEAMRALEERQQMAESQSARDAIKANRVALRNDPNSYVGGNPKGDVTIVEFFDYRCGYCKQAALALKDVARSDGKIRVVYKEFPILGPDSLVAARYGVAAAAQGERYVAFHEAMMQLRGALTEETILQVARETGLDVARLEQDAKSPRVQDTIRANHALAEALGIRGTPAFVIGDDLTPGAIPADRMRELVDLARTSCTTC